MSKITITVSGPTGSGKSAIVGEIEIALKAIGVPVTIADRDTMVVADYQYWIDLYKPEVTIIEENIPCPTTP
jgi:Ni2+-binding GTPase involved in maturation of urease and hydrogenase